MIKLLAGRLALVFLMIALATESYGECKFLRHDPRPPQHNGIDWYYHRNPMAIQMNINPNCPSPHVTDGGRLDILIAAQMWHAQMTDCIDFSVGGNSTATIAAEDGLWTMGWSGRVDLGMAAWPDQHAGLPSYYATRVESPILTPTSYIKECDAFMNAALYEWYSECTPGGSRSSIRRLAAHELGHWIGLGEKPYTNSLMAHMAVCDGYLPTESDRDCGRVAQGCGLIGCLNGAGSWGAIQYCFNGGVSGLSGVQGPIGLYSLVINNIIVSKYVPDTPLGTVWGRRLIWGNFEHTANTYRIYKSSDGGLTYAQVGTVPDSAPAFRASLS